MEPTCDLIKEFVITLKSDKNTAILHEKLTQHTRASSIVKLRMSRVEYTDGYSWRKLLDARFPYFPKAKWLKVQQTFHKHPTISILKIQ